MRCSRSGLPAIIRPFAGRHAEGRNAFPRGKFGSGLAARHQVFMAQCTECDADIDVDEFDVDLGDQLSCSECGALLLVSGVAPLLIESQEAESAAELGERIDEDGDDDVWE